MTPAWTPRRLSVANGSGRAIGAQRLMTPVTADAGGVAVAPDVRYRHLHRTHGLGGATEPCG